MYRCGTPRHLQLSSVARAAINDGLSKRELGTIVYIGIDEISRMKGHTYMTQVYDLDTKRLLWRGEERASDELQAEKTGSCDITKP